MALMGIEAMCPKPRTSRLGFGAGHKVYPYLLGGLEIDPSATRCGFRTWRTSRCALFLVLRILVLPFMNSDQGSTFTSLAFTSVLEERGVRISMDGKGRWIDNVFIERFWRSVKYEEVYLHAYEDLRQARSGIERYLPLLQPAAGAPEPGESDARAGVPSRHGRHPGAGHRSSLCAV